MLAACETRTSRFGAQWALRNWSVNTFSPADFYRMIGYRASKKFVFKGLIRRMGNDVFTAEEAEWFIEWII